MTSFARLPPRRSALNELAAHLGLPPSARLTDGGLSFVLDERYVVHVYCAGPAERTDGAFVIASALARVSDAAAAADLARAGKAFVRDTLPDRGAVGLLDRTGGSFWVRMPLAADASSDALINAVSVFVDAVSSWSWSPPDRRTVAVGMLA